MGCSAFTRNGCASRRWARTKRTASRRCCLASPESDLPDGAERHIDIFIETPLGPEALARRLLRLAHDAKTAEEEQGLNILYLAIGFLRWRESASSEILRKAPLVLLPVQLVRNETDLDLRHSVPRRRHHNQPAVAGKAAAGLRDRFPGNRRGPMAGRHRTISGAWSMQSLGSPAGRSTRTGCSLASSHLPSC